MNLKLLITKFNREIQAEFEDAFERAWQIRQEQILDQVALALAGENPADSQLERQIKIWKVKQELIGRLALIPS